jgi:hypothetical protein
MIGFLTCTKSNIFRMHGKHDVTESDYKVILIDGVLRFEENSISKYIEKFLKNVLEHDQSLYKYKVR